MKRVFYLLIIGTILSGIAAVSASGATGVPLKLWRLDCGTVQVNDLDLFSDTRAYVGRRMTFTDSCYLIKHGDRYLLWDTGLPAALKGKAVNGTDPLSVTVKTTIAEQLATIGVTPDQITTIGISHYHFDHIGQAAGFPGAKLLIGKGDYDALAANPPSGGADPTPLKTWIGGAGAVEAVAGDKDVFGDGRVVMIDLPGHTPGHHGLLVRLAGAGALLLSGDAVHFRENYDGDGVPSFNTNRADTLASIGRLKALAKNLNATLIIQHDARDVAKLPALPAAAE